MVDAGILVPEEPLLRKIDEAVEWERLYEMVKPLCCEDNGWPSVDPVVLVKMADTGYLSPKAVFIDGIHIKANANTKKQVKAEIPVTAKRYAKEKHAMRYTQYRGPPYPRRHLFK